jgi:flagellar M-ring protein FliF
MLEKLQPITESFRKFWGNLSNLKRLALVGATLGVLLTVLAYAAIASRVDYTYLFTDLAPEDAAAIVERLDQQKVPHRLAAGGSAIEVPRDKVHELRVALAADGIPKGGAVGFELFDKNQMGATEFEQQVNLRRALEGELSRSIMTVDGVKGARVHLVLPEKRLFARTDEKASASVVLKLRNAGTFGKKEVAGIVHLVASAVPGLSRDRVSVVSTEGVTLHKPSSGSAGFATDLADLQTEQSTAISSGLEAHVREQLERVVGPGNADVRIAVALDPAARERTEEHYEPTKTALRSEHKIEESAGADNPGVAGVPGAVSNLPDGTAPPEEALAAPNAGGGGTVRRSHTRNWEVERVTEKITTPPGNMRRLSVAVLLNGTYRPDGTFVPRGEKELKNLEALVRGAVGFDEQRGDEITVKSTQFARMTELDAEANAGATPDWLKYWPWAVAGAGALLVGGALVVLVLRRRRKQKLAIVQATAAPAELRGADGLPVQLVGDTPARALPEAPSEDFRTLALELASKDPATAAVVLRRWLHGAAAAGAPAARA